MSNEELDRVFREKLQSYEATPTAQVWQHISLDLRPEGRAKQHIQRIWLAAASFIVFVTIGFLFLPGKPPVKLQASQVTKPKPVEINTPPKQIVVESPQPKGVQFLERLASMRFEGNKHVEDYKVTSKAIAENIAHISQIQQVNVEGPSNSEVVISEPDAPILVAAQPNIEEFVPTPTLNLSKPQPEEASEHRGRIKTLGDIVNFVVRQVDPRKEKLIEFTNHDDGTSVSSINLGLLKIKTKQNDAKLN